jgi:hypothetical protein
MHLAALIWLINQYHRRRIGIYLALALQSLA